MEIRDSGKTKLSGGARPEHRYMAPQQGWGLEPSKDCKSFPQIDLLSENKEKDKFVVELAPGYR